MDNQPSPEKKDQSNAPAEPEVLKTRSNDATTQPMQPTPSSNSSDAKKAKRRTYRPSHKATFIGLAVVIAVLAVNAVVLVFLFKKQTESELEKKGQVTISSADLSRLGINRNNLGTSNVNLVVAPDAQFKGKLAVAGAANISGQLVLNSKLTGTDASLTQLQAGNTSLSQLNVNGDSTLNSLNLRKDLIVTGLTQLQGAVTLGSILTVNNSVNVTGNLTVGGALSAKSINISSLNITSSIVINGHIITNGPTPSVSGGSALGSNGTVSVSGNDAAGVIAINIGAGAGGGNLVSLTFRSQYGTTPKVVVTPVGVGGNFYLSSVGTSGFTVAVSSGLPPGGYRLNYIVMQ